jgi:hypothetical protein
MPQEDDGASELNHPEEIFWVIFPANDGATKVMRPGEQAFDFPAAPVAAQNTAVLCRRCDAHEFVGRDEVYAVSFVNPPIQRVAIVGAIADHSFRRFGKESLVECVMRRSAGHVHGERKTMAVCDCHDFAVFAAFCRADTRALFSPKEHPCAESKRLRSALRGCLATAALVHRVVVSDETTVREPPIGRR